jgi:alpha-1,6-mannosyltransferase
LTLTASRRLYGLGAIIFVALVACSRSEVGTRWFLIGTDIAGIAYLLAVREFFRTRRFPRQIVFACLALSALCRIPYLMTPPGSDDDVHRYLWDGRVQRFGYNPYSAIPADPTLAWLHTPETRGLNNPEVSSPYPAGAQLFFRAVTMIHESIFAFKIAFLLCDIAIVLLLVNVLRRSGQAEHWVLAYAWHPLLALNVAGSPHVDILGVLLLLVSVAALERRWRMIAATALALAVAVKFLPLVLAPLYWRRLRIRDWLLAALVFGALYLPFLQHGRIPIGSLGTFVERFRFNDPVFAMLERAMSPQIVASLAVLVGLVAAVCLRRRRPALSPDNWAWPMAASLACAPVVYPWYLIWLLPFLRSTSTLPLMVWTVSILPTYLVWHLRSLGRQWVVPEWVLLLEYGSVAIAAAIVLLRSYGASGRAVAAEEVPPVSDGRSDGGANDAGVV